MKTFQSRVVHCKRDPYDVYIGRGSKWGNKFRIGVHGDRKKVIQLFTLYQLPGLVSHLDELRGKVLGCWCSPKFCHGHILAALTMEEK